jgi:hypothetical protein
MFMQKRSNTVWIVRPGSEYILDGGALKSDLLSPPMDPEHTPPLPMS